MFKLENSQKKFSVFNLNFTSENGFSIFQVYFPKSKTKISETFIIYPEKFVRQTLNYGHNWSTQTNV